MKPILDEFHQVIGYHCKSAIRLLCHRPAETAETTKRGGTAEEVRAGVGACSVGGLGSCERRLRQAPGPFLPELIPIRTCDERKPSNVGSIEVNLAAHCGSSTEGFYLNKLVAGDMVRGWTECVPTWGKGQSRVS